jgi:predicted NBD/HSP70 family sugar kinase
MTHGQVLQLVREHGPLTRKDLLELSHLSRTTLVERVDTLLRLRFIREGRRGGSGTGRPPVLLEFDDSSRITLSFDIGAAHALIALTDLAGRRLGTRELPVDLTHEPKPVLRRLVTAGSRLLAASRPDGADLLGVGISFPGLVGRVPGTIEAPAVLAHWDGAPVSGPFERAFGTSVTIANDAHAMAYGETVSDGRRRTVIVVKLATGIGAGLVVDGRLHTGDSHGAGQFGHMRVPGLSEECSCGQRGCLATVASGRALLRRLGPHGVATLNDIVEGVERGDAACHAALAEAGRAVGVVLSGVATMTDPGVILFGGHLGRLDPFITAARERILNLTYARTAQEITIGRTVLGDESAVAGLAALIVDSALQPTAVDRIVAARPGGAA